MDATTERPTVLWSLEAQVDPRHAAVVVIDLQNDFVADDGKLARRGHDVSAAGDAIASANRLVTAARKAGAMVVWARVAHAPEAEPDNYVAVHGNPGPPGSLAESLLCLAGSEGAAWHPDLLPRVDDEPEITKPSYSAFFGTDFEAVLDARGIRTLVLAGCNTNVCVHATAIEGFFRGYYVVIAEDACTTAMPASAGAFLDTHRIFYGKVSSTDELAAVWGVS